MLRQASRGLSRAWHAIAHVMERAVAFLSYDIHLAHPHRGLLHLGILVESN